MKLLLSTALLLLARSNLSRAEKAEMTNDGRSAVTAWWAIFNNPAACMTAPGEDIACGSADLDIEATEPSAIWAAGGVADDSGKLFLTSGLYRTADPLVLDEGIDFKGLGRGWTNADAEIHLVIRDHGPVVMENDGYLEQISNFKDKYEGCCSNVQAAPFSPGEQGEKTVYVMSDRTEIEGTKAILNRRGDLLQAIIETTDPAVMAIDDSQIPPITPKSSGSMATNSAEKSSVTMWWVIFNNPAACTTSPGEAVACGSADLDIEATEPSAIWAAGDVADASGKLFLTSGLYRTADPLVLDEGIDFKGLGRGWTDPDAEIHLVIRDHGPVVLENDGYLEQISNFNDQYEGCCSNVQAAPFSPGEQGEKTLYVMGDRTEIEGTKAILNRRGDLLQAIIETIDPAMMPSDDDMGGMMTSSAQGIGAVPGSLFLISAVIFTLL